jgi:hypothetical protein
VSTETNKAAVRRYFTEALDGGRREVLDEIMVPGCVAHFPGRDAPADRGALARSGASSFVTTLHHLVAEDDLVVAHLTHVVTYRPGEVNDTRVGKVDVGEKTITWDAIAIFRFEGGLIAEEWVNRDELGQLLQAGAVKPAVNV